MIFESLLEMDVLNEQYSSCLLLRDCTNPEEITSLAGVIRVLRRSPKAWKTSWGYWATELPLHDTDPLS